MKTYTLDLVATVTFRGIEAESEEAAIAIAESRTESAMINGHLSMTDIDITEIEEDENV